MNIKDVDIKHRVFKAGEYNINQPRCPKCGKLYVNLLTVIDGFFELEGKVMFLAECSACFTKWYAHTTEDFYETFVRYTNTR